MPQRWTEEVPQLRGRLATLREVDPSDVDTLYTLFSDPAVTAYMAPPPPTHAKLAGFVEWAHAQREKGKGICFGIVPEGMTTAVGILQVRSLAPEVVTAEWGFVLGAHFWSTGVFQDAANALAEFAFTEMHVQRLEARIALRNARAHGAVRKLGAHHEATFATPSPSGVPRDPEMLWALSEADWRNRTGEQRLSSAEAARRVQDAIAAAECVLRTGESPKGVPGEPYPLFMFDRRRRE